MGPIARIIDANANRAREALRVMEDAARFALDDEALARELKEIRHALREALDSLSPLGADAAALLAWRDTPGDVGTRIDTRPERDRAGIRGVALAAGKRAGEALRAMEECAKALTSSSEPRASGPPADAPSPDRALESLRYRLYDAEKRLNLALGGARAPQWRVCVILTESLCRQPWLEVARASILAGADCLQLREKDLTNRELLARARALVALARETPAPGAPGRGARPAVIVNDRPDIALLAGADGAHLGQTDLRVDDARRLAGQTLLVGVSASSIEEARAALHAGADYCGVGAMFETTTKRKESIAGTGLMRAYTEHEPALPPHLAIGGVTPANIREVIDAGGRGVAVCSCACAAENPGEIVRSLVRALGRE